MITRLEALAKIEIQMVGDMDKKAGQGIKVRTIFNALKALDAGKYATLGEAQKAFGFNAQNTVWQGIGLLLEHQHGIKLIDFADGGGAGRSKLDGTSAIEKLLKQNGLELKQPKKKS